MFQKSYFSSLVTLARWPVLALSAAWLSGCALAPGLSIGKGLQTSEASHTTTSVSGVSGQGVEPGSEAGRGTSALLSITPELISQQRALQKADLGPDVKRLFGEGKAYSIGPSDVIDIVVWNHPELALTPAGYNVSPDGLIQFPLLGTFKIAGLTETQARDALTRQLSKFVKNPQITLRVQAYRAGRVYVDGEVNTPGLQVINDIAMTLPEALSRAGGLRGTADQSNVAVIRNGVTTLVNIPQLVKLGVNPSRILLAPGDLVRVASRDDAKVYVMGEVTRPMSLPLRNGRLTLNEALGESGGVNGSSGDPRQIYVVRSLSGDSARTASASGSVKVASTSAAGSAIGVAAEIYHLDARSPAAYALAEGFELKSRDVVFVDPVPLVLWNRVISLILPSAQAVTVTRTVSN